MTSISIDACLPAQETPRARKIFAFGFVHMKTRAAQSLDERDPRDDLHVLGMVVIEDDGESKALHIQPKA